jgi:hypothetical protein
VLSEVAAVKHDLILGRAVQIRSNAGIVYRGIVRAIRDGDELGELFELGSAEDRDYRRLVYVTDRAAQVQEIVP